MINVLLVEDDIDLATTIVDYLEIESIECDHASNGVMDLNLIERNQYQMIILDVNMPKMDGLTMCKTLRERGIDTPVLMLTARDSLDSKLEGFAAGSDDYLVKPFAMKELVARVKVLAKRKSGEVKRLTFANLTLDLTAHTATVEAGNLKLSPITFKLLELLIREQQKPVTRHAIMQAIWGEEQPDSNSLKVHIYHLRKQLEQANCQAVLETIPSVGFVLKLKNETHA
ncbi:response regulator transcription factor [Pseudoalteromonas sp. SWYJZ19]|uniref:response regulator transcription factor n=1 Tax=Pseudoalteromonas sp. SWYJZ19 TaxID=2792068 RepID=UPI0018CEBE86|nr:response regulator transcription factor [Pseudoalteromonas sp. SWYJZ19]MBH0049267.1 response regulator transcription factor [Pseudoalteromonas sp. SWYJZ19]